MDGVAIAQNIMGTSLHQEIHRITDTEEHAREFLFQRGILKATKYHVLSWLLLSNDPGSLLFLEVLGSPYLAVSSL